MMAETGEHHELREAMARVRTAADESQRAAATDALMEQLRRHLDGSEPQAGLEWALRHFVDELIADVYLNG